MFDSDIVNTLPPKNSNPKARLLQNFYISRRASPGGPETGRAVAFPPEMITVALLQSHRSPSRPFIRKGFATTTRGENAWLPAKPSAAEHSSP
jgi:hypothetical protein